jgi:PAS domain S-box-containing protein
VLILALAILLSIIDRRFARHAQEIADSRLQLQSIFDNMTECLVVLDLKRNIVIANQTAVNLLGLTTEVLASERAQNNFDVLTTTGHPLPPEQWPAALALRGEFLKHRELMIRRKDTGNVITAEVTTTPIRNHAGASIQFIVSYRDITESQHNAEARARLAAIVDSSDDAIIGKDEVGIVRSWNAAAQRMFGYTAEEMIGQSILRLVPADREKEEFGFLNQIRRGEIISHIETLRKTKDGKSVNVSLTISPIRDKDGTIVGASKIARDITARKQLERQLQQSQKMEAVGQLTGGIAHDFNNLLGVIVGNLELLEKLVVGNEPASKRVQTALKAALRGADLTRRLLSFSSSEELSPTPTVLKDSILNTLELAERTLGPEITIKADLSEAIPPVFVDRAGLENALLNLMVNARDAMPKGGTLSIKSELVALDESYAPVKAGNLQPGTYACICVTDTGVGMSRETLERALEPFFTTKPRGKGTGLGLAMVYGFVKQSGGTVLLYSELGYGTTVKFYLRLATEQFKTTKTLSLTSSAATPGRKVLVVDDEVELLEIASSYLHEMGYTTFQAANGASALEVLHREPGIELVVTDVIMPGGMNGVELVEKIRQLIPGIKVIYSSGFPSDALTERNGTVVDGRLLRKPYQRSEFDALVRETLEEPNSQ